MPRERYLDPDQSSTNRERRERIAAEQYPEAARMARAAGMRLFRRSEIHYQLVGADGWLLSG